MMSSKKILGALGAAGVALGALCSPASAEDREFGWTWTGTGASDYIFRGISYTQNNPTINSYLEFTYGIGYVGFWTSNIDTCDGDGCLGSWEQDVYAGIRPVTGPVNWDIGVLYYLYGVRGDTFSEDDFDYFEFKVAATTSPITNLTLGATFYYQPDQDLAATENISIEGNFAYELPKLGMFTPTLVGLIGYSDSDTNDFYTTGYWLGDDQYTYWNAGIKLGVEHVTLDFRYWDTNNVPADPANEKFADERFVATASFTLP